MRPKIAELLQAALPKCCASSIMVNDEALEQGGDAGFMRAIRRQLTDVLARFIVDAKVLDGTDKTGFTMRPHPSLAATECTMKVYVMTPQEVELLVGKAFAAGMDEGRMVPPKPYDNPYRQEYILPSPEEYGSNFFEEVAKMEQDRKMKDAIRREAEKAMGRWKGKR